MKSSSLTLTLPGSPGKNNLRSQAVAAGAHLHSRPTRRIRVLFADDHPVVRQGVRWTLEGQPGLEIVGEAADGREALRKARELTPDVLLTDIDMPHLNGLILTETLRRELPGIKVLVLSMHNTTEFMLRCIQAGARGYVLKQAAPEEYLRAIEMVNAGESYFSSDLARLALNQLVRGKGPGPDLASLTHREREVLALIAEGLCNKEIACRLNIGTRTVETHRERLMRKLDIHSIAGLTRFAISKGMVNVPDLMLAEA